MSYLVVETIKNFLPTCIEINEFFFILANLPIYQINIRSNVLMKKEQVEEKLQI
jgi:hypothetical protein